ncbi:hypothetical protein EVAR_47324_1 [Eumeta japonica]|uniref:Uncharacterized protein n=1 Tax=Eumeta variegata TaxID=151549 RepID=A0A4C1YLL6_EUMVA|nr:hypothetical protein EVAR_47324_1 [Eumeta japonica]
MLLNRVSGASIPPSTWGAQLDVGNRCHIFVLTLVTQIGPNRLGLCSRDIREKNESRMYETYWTPKSNVKYPARPLKATSNTQQEWSSV